MVASHKNIGLYNIEVQMKLSRSQCDMWFDYCVFVFWNNHLGTEAVKTEEKSDVIDENPASQQLHPVKEVKSTHQGTSQRKSLI